MGGFLDKPKTEKTLESGSGNGLQYGVVSMQGWRVEMEDSHTAVTGLEGELKAWSYFAVFDGHCGSGVSAHCSQNLLPTILQTEEFKKLKAATSTAEGDAASNPSESTRGDAVPIIKDAIRTGFLQLDREMRKMQSDHSDDKSGSTAVCVLISPDHFFIANCGDSRAVLCRKGTPAVCTLDHKPTVPAEKKRIQDAGGSVMIHRVNGSLAVSRALGDFEYKCVEGKGDTEQLVSPEPEIYVEERKPEEDEFIVLACDGIWDVMSNEDLCQFVSRQMTITDDLTKVATAIVDTCLYKGSRDNMSIVLIAFPAAPKPIPEAAALEEKFDEQIRRRTLEILKEDPEVEASRVLQILSDEQLPDTPPGSAIGSKRTFIESVIKSSKNGTSDQDVNE